MRKNRLFLITGIILLAGVLLIVVPVWAAPRLAAYTWSSSNTDATGYFYNSGTGGGVRGAAVGSTSLAVYGWNSGVSGQGVRGYGSGSSGYGVYGNSPYFIGVRGDGGSGSGDYGGYFAGFEGVRGTATGSNGFGTWGIATGSTGIGAYGYGSGTGGYGAYGYSPYNTGVYGRGGSGSGDYGGYFYGFEGVRGAATGSNGYGTWGTAGGPNGIGAYGYASGTGGYGVYAYSPNYTGVYARGDEYGAYLVGDRGVFGYTGTTSGQGVYGYTTARTGEGVRGYTGGYGGDGVTGYATSSYGFGVDSLATGYRGYGLRGQATGTGSWAAYFNSSNYNGLYANGGGSYYDAYFPDRIYAGGTVVSSLGMAVVARNDGAETLEVGDLVVFRGVDASAMGTGEPALSVAKAGRGNGMAVVGVVQGAYVVEAFAPAEAEPAEAEAAEEALPQPAGLPEATEKDVSLLPPGEVPEGEAPPVDVSAKSVPGASEGEKPEAKALHALEDPPDVSMESNVLAGPAVGRFVEGSVEPGQYVVIAMQGFARVKVDAAGAIRAGDWVVTSVDGRAMAVSAREYDKALGQGSVIVGRALEPLDKSSGMVYVYLNFR